MPNKNCLNRVSCQFFTYGNCHFTDWYYLISVTLHLHAWRTDRIEILPTDDSSFWLHQVVVVPQRPPKVGCPWVPMFHLRAVLQQLPGGPGDLNSARGLGTETQGACLPRCCIHRPESAQRSLDRRSGDSVGLLSETLLWLGWRLDLSWNIRSIEIWHQGYQGSYERIKM